MDSDPGFRAARQAGERGVGRLVFPLVFIVLLALLGFMFLFSDGGASGTSPVFLGVLGLLAAIALFVLVRDVRRRVRRNSAWSRAARGAVTLTLRGEAVGKQRTVAGRPMRTVVVQHGGEPRYLHLLFATGVPAGTVRQGPITVEFFARDDVEGPARILLPDGRTSWAFASRLGGQAPVDGRRTGSWGAAAGATGAGATGAGAAMPATLIGGPGSGDDDPDRGREHDGSAAGGGTIESVWSGDDGWTGGSSWSGDSTWSGADGSSGGGGGWSGGDSGGGWSGGGWSGGDVGGGGGDSGGGGS
ncbi:hypothetical protein [Promicromonospora soli]